MESVSYVVEKIVRENLFLSEGLRGGLLSYSRTAMYILPEVQRRVPDARAENVAVVLQRLAQKVGHTRTPEYKIGKIKLRTGMAHASFARSAETEKFASDLYGKIGQESGGYLSVTVGETEITAIFSEENAPLFKRKGLLELETGLALVTLDFPPEMVESVGLVAHILNEARWAGVNVRELFSTYTELGILVREKESQALYNAMLRLKGLKKAKL